MSAEHEVFFGRLFGQSTASVATSAVAANGESGVGNASPNALVAFDPASCGAGQINGNGQVNITNLGDPGTRAASSTSTRCAASIRPVGPMTTPATMPAPVASP